MNKYNIKLISWFIIILFFLVLISSCGNESEKAEQNVGFVSKKIVLNKTVVQDNNIKLKENNNQLKKNKLTKTQAISDVVDQDAGDMQKKNIAEKLVQKPLYDPYVRIDPFAPLFKKKIVRTVKKKQRIALTPLEKTDLSQLKLTGIIQGTMGNKALVEEASGKGYVVTKGTYIGIHAGKVSKIFKDRIIVEEEEENLYGKIVIQKRELKLQKPPGEQ